MDKELLKKIRHSVTLLEFALLTVLLPRFLFSTALGDIPKVNLNDSLRLVNILTYKPNGPPRVRRECRMLNRSEFERLTAIINIAKNDTRLQPNVYDAFAYLHANPDVIKGAHQGPGFLPFHRILVFFYEKLLRLYDPEVSLCYWDSTLEPSDWTTSHTWTSSLFGNVRGHVRIGFAEGWLTPLGPLTRDGGKEGRPFYSQDISMILSRRHLGEISYPHGYIGSNFEEKHNLVHSFVGGLMRQVETASYDPIFWFHHAYIDCVYEQFRAQQSKHGIEPMRDWPHDYGHPNHSPFAAMRLGRLRLLDGINNFFPQHTFRCEPSPANVICRLHRDCGIYMRCQSGTNRCISDTLATSQRNVMKLVDENELRQSASLSKIQNLLASTIMTRGFNQIFKIPEFSVLGLKHVNILSNTTVLNNNFTALCGSSYASTTSTHLQSVC